MFQCVKCGEHCDNFLFHSGKRKPTCKVCSSYRYYVASYPGTANFPAYKVRWLAKYFDKQMELRGWKRCGLCHRIKPVSHNWARNLCRPCHNERSREWKQKHRNSKSRYQEYKRRNDARGHQTWGSRSRRKKVLAERARQLKISRTLACSHVIAYYAWLKSEASDERVKSHYQDKPWNNPRLSSAEAWRIRYRLDKAFQVSERLRRQANKARKKDNVADHIRAAIRRNGESRTVNRLLGYSISELCDHLEKQFTRGMSWKRFMNGEIHIDHIVPQAAFDLSDPNEWRKCWCLSNLRPCWAGENIRKRDQRLYLL